MKKEKVKKGKVTKVVLHCRVEERYPHSATVVVESYNGKDRFRGRSVTLSNTLNVIGVRSIPKEGKEYKAVYELDPKGKFIMVDEIHFRRVRGITPPRWGLCCLLPQWWGKRRERFNRTTKLIKQIEKENK